MHLNVSHYVTVAKALKEKKSHRCPTHLSIDSVEKSVEARRWHQINASRPSNAAQPLQSRGISLIPSFGLLLRGINLILSFGLLLRQVYILYRAVLFRLRLAGYVPNNTSQVLSGCDSVGDNAHDREEKQALFSRSEKLAVCFGRISTKAGVPVYIFKNIRICQGYHCATKVVPTIYMTGKLLSEIAIIFVVSGKVYVLLVIIGDRNCTMLTNAERNNLCNLSFVYIITYLRILS
ncbi:pentatricopeptide repeat-containing protein At1g08070, chloroplastic-like isoform X4 [Cornus florida]|uniref:pentatricopeptide repeat-containing protein At1g08070, chloroplastic-like isoform X4 n=1 Tax=Cornus florida TaxID=4283 RepID=UPI00289DCE34|nr:pentatricopeptide repeat-containing protein At1g08070, chloroplastic-like isoform X4 [Cornus florida]